MARQCIEMFKMCRKSAFANILIQDLCVFGKEVSHTVFLEKVSVYAYMHTYVLSGGKTAQCYVPYCSSKLEVRSDVQVQVQMKKILVVCS